MITRLYTLLIVIVFATAVRVSGAEGPVVGIIVDDDRPRVALKVAGYIDDFLVYTTKVITKSEYASTQTRFAATVTITQTGRDNIVSLSIMVRNGSSVSSYSAGGRFNSQVPGWLIQNRQAMDAAKYVLKQLDTECWKGLVEEFDDDVEELDSMD